VKGFRNVPLRCNDCGRFISPQDKEAFVYTPFGGPMDLELPEDRYICGGCFTTNRGYLIKRIAWMGPTRLVG
jgi:hypothetical protein